MNDRHKIVAAFCSECVWARAVREHFSVLFEQGEKRRDLLAEVAKTFFGDLNLILMEYVLLQQCKLTDPAKSGKDKDNLTTNYLLTLTWSTPVSEMLKGANDRLMAFRIKIDDARRKLIAHSDLRATLSLSNLSSFTQGEERAFWIALQDFVNAAHEEAIGGPFEIAASMPDGDGASLIHALVDAVDYDDLVNQEDGFLVRRVGRRRYEAHNSTV